MIVNHFCTYCLCVLSFSPLDGILKEQTEPHLVLETPGQKLEPTREATLEPPAESEIKNEAAEVVASKEPSIAVSEQEEKAGLPGSRETTEIKAGLPGSHEATEIRATTSEELPKQPLEQEEPVIHKLPMPPSPTRGILIQGDTMSSIATTTKQSTKVLERQGGLFYTYLVCCVLF